MAHQQRRINFFTSWIIMILFIGGSHAKTVFVVLSQHETYHVNEAEIFKEHFMAQVKDIAQNDQPDLMLLHKDFIDVPGAWTILNLIQPLWEMHERDGFDWVFICEEDTRINVKPLLTFLSTFDQHEKLFLGRALRDQSATIIHHFAFFDNPGQFAYPDFRAGFAISIGLLKWLQNRITTGKLKTDFNIDVKHELALFIWDEGNGTALSDVEEFCFADESKKFDCLTTQPTKFPDCGPPIPKDKLFVAVKTCKQFHTTRVPVVKATWAMQAGEIVFYSDEEDKSIPTLATGVPNTERGHCGKTMAIIRRVLAVQHHTRPKWVLIADDDTIINLDRLRSLLSCYNNHREPVALGERYGFGVVKGRGYDYITGGGGMVFNVPAITLLKDQCRCYSDDSPDDMTLGMCLQSIGIPVTHSRYFHQARPEDYSESLLSNQHPVSFHKHWNTDPYKVFKQITKPIVGMGDFNHSSDGTTNKRDEL